MNFFEDFKNVVREGASLLANLTVFAAEKLAGAVRSYFRQVQRWSIRLFIAAVAPLVLVAPSLIFHAPWGWLYGTYIAWLVLLLAAELLLLTPIALAWKRIKALPILGPDLQEWLGFIKTVVFNGLSLGIFATLFPVWRSPGAFPLLLLVLACWLTLPACSFSDFFKKIYPAVRSVQLLLLAGLLGLQMAFPTHLDQLMGAMARKFGGVLTSSIKQQEVTPQWRTLQWFNNVGEPQVWFSGSAASGFRLWAAPGFDPDSGAKLLPLTDEQTKNRIVVALAELERLEQQATAKRQAELTQQAEVDRRSREQLRRQEEETAAKRQAEMAAQAGLERRNREEQQRKEQEVAAKKQADEALLAAEEKQRQLAKERAEFIARHLVPSQLTNSPQAQEVAVLVANEARQPDSAAGRVLVAALQTRAAKASASLFTPEFISDGLFERAFAGSRGALDGLELTNAADTLLFARESVEYSKTETVQGMVTARLKLELSALSAATGRQSQAHAAMSTGVGFKEADARALAEERMLKLIGGKELDTFLNAILNKPQ